MNPILPQDLADRLAADWNEKIDALRQELGERQAAAYRHGDAVFGRNLGLALNDQSNEVEIARRIFNHYLATGDVEFPD